jgi:hypothetical protein
VPKAIASLGLVETCRKRRVWGALSAGRCTSRRLESLQIVFKIVLLMFIVLSGVTFWYFRFLVCSLSVLCLRNLFVDSRGWKLHETRSRHKEADGCEWASWWSLSAAPESSPECWTLLEQVVISSSWIRVDWQFIFFLEGWRHHGSEYWNHELV